MKKLKLKALQLGAKEVLTRAQLKNILGGDGSGSGCTQDSQCGTGSYCNGGVCATAGGGSGSGSSCPSGQSICVCVHDGRTQNYGCRSASECSGLCVF